jgi:hypothetical protein
MTDSSATWSLRRPFHQMASLPLRLKLWLGWLMISTLFVPLLFLQNPFFGAMMICQLLNLVFGTILMLRFGLVRLLGLSHLVFWTPILAKFNHYYDALLDPTMLALAWITVLTIGVSLLLDARDVVDWVGGKTDPVGQ